MKHLIILLIATSLILASCGIQKKGYEFEGIHSVDMDFLEPELRNPHYGSGEPAIAWWREFQDPVLDSLIEKARDRNLDINVAVANFQAARALLEGTKLDRYPTVKLNGEYLRTRLGENVFAPGDNPTYSTYTGSFDAFWELDLFGRVSHRIKGARANGREVLADMRGVYIRIFAEVANTYLELRGNQYLLDIARRNLQGQEDTYQLTLQRSGAGTSNSLDVSRALAQLEATRASIPPLEARIGALGNSLAVLVGQVPDGLDGALAQKRPLPSLPASVALGDIQDLLRRRPDVKGAEAQLQQRVARYNISVANLYPQIHFGGSIGFSATDFANFGSKESFSWSLFPSIRWAAFDLGRVRKQIKRDDALALAALSHYEKTVLESLEEIKTALGNYSQELKRREMLRTSSKASARAATMARERYLAGLDDFIDYLSADHALLQSENALAQSEIAAATALVAIYKALGGGWEIISPEELRDKIGSLD